MNDFPERRAFERSSYEAIIYWAPYRDHKFPSINDFRSAETSDLSREGFSFFWPTAINDSLILVSLKSPETASLCLAAHVIHCHQGFWDREPKFRIGCKIASTIPNRLCQTEKGSGAVSG